MIQPSIEVPSVPCELCFYSLVENYDKKADDVFELFKKVLPSNTSMDERADVILQIKKLSTRLSVIISALHFQNNGPKRLVSVQNLFPMTTSNKNSSYYTFLLGLQESQLKDTAFMQARIEELLDDESSEEFERKVSENMLSLLKITDENQLKNPDNLRSKLIQCFLELKDDQMNVEAMKSAIRKSFLKLRTVSPSDVRNMTIRWLLGRADYKKALEVVNRVEKKLRTLCFLNELAESSFVQSAHIISEHLNFSNYEIAIIQQFQLASLVEHIENGTAEREHIEASLVALQCGLPQVNGASSQEEAQKTQQLVNYLDQGQKLLEQNTNKGSSKRSVKGCHRPAALGSG